MVNKLQGRVNRSFELKFKFPFLYLYRWFHAFLVDLFGLLVYQRVDSIDGNLNGERFTDI